eukprot:GHVO01004885.1.p1 GENE.GHVO01004885.1~~GHVO01004885.1.p1  ORF type:complete len:211 (+),score=15.61 GHVO01004885.1:420-1052(+)
MRVLVYFVFTGYGFVLFQFEKHALRAFRAVYYGRLQIQSQKIEAWWGERHVFPTLALLDTARPYNPKSESSDLKFMKSQWLEESVKRCRNDVQITCDERDKDPAISAERDKDPAISAGSETSGDDAPSGHDIPIIPDGENTNDKPPRRFLIKKSNRKQPPCKVVPIEDAIVFCPDRYEPDPDHAPLPFLEYASVWKYDNHYGNRWARADF